MRSDKMRADLTSERGQTIVMYTLSLSLLFRSLGLVVDLGWANFRREAAQAAADAAAGAAATNAYVSAGGGSINCSTPNVACYATPHECSSTLTSPPSDNIVAACLYARDNGFTNGGRYKVTLQSGVGSVPTAAGAPMSYWVIARVSETIPQLFSAVLGFPNLTVTGRATSGARVASGGGCVITLNPTASSAIGMTGSSALTTGCGVFDNSNASDAINIVGGGTITTTGTAKTNIVGNWNGSGTISPAPFTGAPIINDPLADLTPPTVGACTDTAGINGGSHDHLSLTAPQVLCGGISMGAQSTLTLSPGIYIVKNGISLGAQTTMTGTGVFIYVQSGAVNMSGGATVSLTPPTSGVWNGVLFYQDRSDTTASTLVGGTAQTMNGILYFPSANLTYTGGSSTSSTQTTLVSDTLNLVGNSWIQAEASSPYTGISGGAYVIE